MLLDNITTRNLEILKNKLELEFMSGDEIDDYLYVLALNVDKELLNRKVEYDR